MRSLNQVQLIGNLGQDPELRTTTNGIKVASLSVATSESFKKGTGWETKTEWHRVSAWSDIAERMARDLKKGDRVYVSGKLQTRKWNDQQGNERVMTEIVAREYIPIDKKSQSSSSTKDEAPRQQRAQAPKQQQPKYNQEDDDVPF